MLRFTKKQHEQDSMILGAIIAGSKNKPLMPYEPQAEMENSVCAIGAGIIGVYKDEKVPESVPSALKLFSEIHEVSLEYAKGVNDGFEQNQWCRHESHYKNLNESKDYQRGWSVGEAANTIGQEYYRNLSRVLSSPNW